MAMTDPIADMLTRIRNANSVKHETVQIPSSNMKKEIARILLEEGYITAYDVTEDGKQGMLEIKLKNGELYLYHNWDTPKLLAKLVKLKNGVFRVDYYNKRAYPQKVYYTAWDIKYKTMVDVDDKLNIIYNNYQKFK